MTPRELALRASSPRLICVTIAVLIWPGAVAWNVGKWMLVDAPGRKPS